MSNVPPRSARSSILGKSLCANTRFAHTDPLRNALQHRVQKEKPLPHGVQNGLFRYRYSVPHTVWSIGAKLSLEANESAKSPSPSLAGQSVIVNQAGLLAPVHRSSASSQGSLPSDCQPPSAYGITRCYSGVTAPAYTGFPIKHVAILSYSLHLIQYIFSFYVTIG